MSDNLASGSMEVWRFAQKGPPVAHRDHIDIVVRPDLVTLKMTKRFDTPSNGKTADLCCEASLTRESVKARESVETLCIEAIGLLRCVYLMLNFREFRGRERINY
jgi:hypothetical protein